MIAASFQMEILPHQWKCCPPDERYLRPRSDIYNSIFTRMKLDFMFNQNTWLTKKHVTSQHNILFMMMMMISRLQAKASLTFVFIGTSIQVIRLLIKHSL